MKLGLVAIALSGCELLANIPTPQGSPDVDAAMNDADTATDAAIDGDGCTGSFVRICTRPSDADIELPAAIDTSTSTLCSVEMDAIAGELCVIGGRSVNLAAGITLEVTGTRPLVLVASTTITVDGTMNVHNPSGIGCSHTDPTELSGGAGGTHGGKGGKGGNGGDNGVGGVANDPMPPSLLGGCPGGLAGNANPPGVGGGSVLLVANTIMVTGTIDAAGTGGGGSKVSLGAGSGGGSGGVIVLDAPAVTIAGTLLASGGGGGEGGRGAILGGNQGGNAGATPNPLMPIVAAAGGSGLPGGDGGAGGAILSLNGTDGGRSGTNVPTGGGGGGGTGIIVVTASAPTITGPVVPAAM